MADAPVKDKATPAPAKKQVSPAALKPRPPRPRYKKRAPGEESEGTLARRAFVWHSTAGFITTLAICFARFFYPRALFEPKTKFPIGFPSDYGFGVDTKLQSTKRIWVCRDASGLYVILARCTHLGCTPDWKPSENKFKCPCHGSGFTSEGMNFEGPAPMPLLRCHLTTDPTGQVVVDKLIVYTYDQFKAKGAGSEGPLLAV